MLFLSSELCPIPSDFSRTHPLAQGRFSVLFGYVSFYCVHIFFIPAYRHGITVFQYDSLEVTGSSATSEGFFLYSIIIWLSKFVRFLQFDKKSCVLSLYIILWSSSWEQARVYPASWLQHVVPWSPSQTTHLTRCVWTTVARPARLMVWRTLWM